MTVSLYSNTSFIIWNTFVSRTKSVKQDIAMWTHYRINRHELHMLFLTGMGIQINVIGIDKRLSDQEPPRSLDAPKKTILFEIFENRNCCTIVSVPSEMRATVLERPFFFSFFNSLVLCHRARKKHRRTMTSSL